MPTERIQRTARKLDRAKTVELADRGMSTADIAQHQGVAPSTVFRFLQQTKPERQALEQFKSHRADCLARLQGMTLDIQDRLLRTMNDAVLGALKPGEKTGLLIALNATAGTAFDKERLERGQSTSNQSIMSTMLNATVKSLYAPKPGIENHRKEKRASPDAKEIQHDG
jgi:hypothetical protein